MTSYALALTSLLLLQGAANAAYQGCYADNMAGIPAMTGSGTSQVPNSAQLCINHCAIGGFSFAGTESSDQCFCSNSLPDQGSSDFCNALCSGSGNSIDHLDFDPVSLPDISPGATPFIPQGYGGLNWGTNFRMAFMAGFGTNNGYHTLLLDGPNNGQVGFVWSSWTSPGEIFPAASGDLFSLFAMKIAPAWRNNMVVEFKGYDASNNLVAQKNVDSVSVLTVTRVTFNDDWTNLSKITMFGTGGTHAAITNNSGCATGNYPCNHIVVDNLDIALSNGPAEFCGGPDSLSVYSTSGASVDGDPHFHTWKDEHFEFHGQCDLVMTSVKKFGNKDIDLDIHLRTSMVRYWSYIKTAAIRIGNDILEIEGSAAKEDGRDKRHYWLNFEYRAELSEVGGFPVTVSPRNNKYTIDLGSVFPGQKIEIKTFKEFVGVKMIGASEESFGTAVGITGDFKTGKTLGRDGSTEIHDFNDLGMEWQVLPSDGTLFHETARPQFPELCLLPEDPRGERARRLGESEISEEAAEAACAGLQNELDRKDCVYDIIATQDMDMVGAY